MGDLLERISYLANTDNEVEEVFIDNFKELQDIAHDIALSKGWWNPPKTFGEQLVLFHAEISEAIEEYRKGHKETEIYCVDDSFSIDGKPEGIPIEFADLFIRLLDTCGRYDIDLIGATLRKMKYNLTRSQRHGGKVI